MSELSPADCAVAVRSFPRRLAEQLADPSEPADERARQRAVDAEAVGRRLLDLLQKTDHELKGSPVGGPAPAPPPSTPLIDAVAGVAARLAERIEQMPADGWSDAGLSSLRTSVAEGGRLLRQLA